MNLQPARQAALALCMWCGASIAVAATNCAAQLGEFALLGHMNLEAESVAAYGELRKACASDLQTAAGEALPPAHNASQVLALGRKLYIQSRDARAKHVVSALSDQAIPAASANVLRGLGPENAWRALGGMAFDVLAAGLESRQHSDQARSATQMGDAIRGKEQRWTGSTSSERRGSWIDAEARRGASSTAPSQPEIPLDMAAASAASCSGTLDFLAPQMRPYTAPMLANVRRDILGTTIPEMIAAGRQQVGSKAVALQQMNAQLDEYNSVGNDSARAANQTDGTGDSRSISLAVSDSLELGYPCGQGAAVHVGAVCNFILMRWGSLAVRASIAVMERCWEL